MADPFRTLNRLIPKPDGEMPVRHRTGIVDVVNGDGTVDLDLGGVIVPGASVLAGVTLVAGDTVQVLVWGGDLLVLGVANAVSDYQLLDEVVAAGGTSVMTISNIPQTHRDLLGIIHGSHPAASGGAFRNVTVRFNGDSGTNYRFVRVDTDDNGTPTRASGLGVTGLIVGSFGDDTDLSMCRFEVPDYAAVTNHPMTFQSGGSFGGSAGQSRAADGWGTHVSSVAAITSITATITTEDWRAGSEMRLYGLGRL